MALVFFGCQHDGSDPVGQGQGYRHTGSEPVSLTYFEAAEQQVAIGRYTFAAKHLNKGIIAFRIETGKMSGPGAIRANRSIDALTRLRKTLRHGEPVMPDDLHQAILTAMESEPMRAASLPKPTPELFVPVSGN